jgi:hypothetical protein
MPETLIPNFSKKILLLALLVILINASFFGISILSERSKMQEMIAPRIISAEIETIDYKSAYDEDYRSANPDQIVSSGAMIRTGEAEFAEIRFEKNSIRLNENTTIRVEKSNFYLRDRYLSSQPRMVIDLLEGSLWINAYDLITVKAKRAEADYFHSLGSVVYGEPLNRVMAVTGSAELRLLDENGEILNEFLLPIGNQVTFIDSQLTEDYRALRFSKLKKEMKMAPISEEVKQEPWFISNSEEDETLKVTNGIRREYSPVAYAIKKGWNQTAVYLMVSPEPRRDSAIKRLELMVGYILGYLEREQDLAEAKAVLDEVREIYGQRSDDPKVRSFMTDAFFATQMATVGSPAYELKEFLLDDVIRREGAETLRIYLADLRRYLSMDEVDQAAEIAGEWLTHWPVSRIMKDSDEFANQSKILKHTLLSYIDRVPIDLLSVFDETGVRQMDLATEISETRLEVTQDRLDMARALVASYRYLAAKQYLKNSYLSLDIDSLDDSVASTKIFLEGGRLLAQRIEYAEEVLRGAAAPIDETEFRVYFTQRTRDEALSDDLRSFLELGQEEQITSSKIEPPAIQDVVNRFAQARISLDFQDIRRDAQAPFTFHIENARLAERASDGSLISFDGEYDYTSNSVSGVVTRDKEYSSAYLLSDLVLILKRGGSLDTEDPVTENDSDEVLSMLATDEEQIEAQRAQAIAQDVARKLAFSQLNEVGIVVPDVKFNIEIIDQFDLDEFRIKNANIFKPNNEGAILVHFVYDSGTKIITNLFDDEGNLLIKRAPASQVVQQVIEIILEQERQQEKLEQLNETLLLNDLEADEDDILLLESGNFKIDDLSLKTLPVSVDAVFNPEEEILVQVTYEEESESDIALEDYFESLIRKLVIQHFNARELALSEEEIITVYPFEKINISDMDLQGYTLSFDYNFDEKTLGPISESSGADFSGLNTLSELRERALELRAEEERQAAEEEAAAAAAEAEDENVQAAE